jgi:hypothetical protein
VSFLDLAAITHAAVKVRREVTIDELFDMTLEELSEALESDVDSGGYDEMERPDKEDAAVAHVDTADINPDF